MYANQYFIYIFKIKKTNEVIYVGSTKAITSRLNEHRRAFRESKRALPIHKWMLENNLKLFDDVEVSIVEFMQDVTKEEVLEREAEYYFKYKDTLKNTRPAEIRSGKFSVKSKPVKCLNDDKEFISIKEASKHYGISSNTIGKHLNNGCILKNGLIFEFINDIDKKERSIHKVTCVDDSLFFSTYKSCAEHYGMTCQQIYNYFRNKNEFRYCGKVFKKCND